MAKNEKLKQDREFLVRVFSELVGALRPYHSGANTRHGGNALGSHESAKRPDLEEGQAEVDDHDPMMEDYVAVKARENIRLRLRAFLLNSQ